MEVTTLEPNINSDLLRGYADELDGSIGFDYGIGNLNNSITFQQVVPGEFSAKVSLSPNVNYHIRAKAKWYWESEWTYGQVWEVPVVANSRFGSGGKII
jgi:hypothetical protein